MTNRTETISQGFNLLRGLCDPRGHDLIDALQDLCILENMALETVLDESRSLSSNVVSMIGRYSEKVPCA
jgi:hypothetical protein